MKTFHKNVLLFSLSVILSQSLCAQERTDYHENGMITSTPKERSVDYTNEDRYLPKIVEEERTYGQLEIVNKTKDSQSFDYSSFKDIYKKAGSPKIVFFVEHNFNDAIGVHSETKNKIEKKELIREYKVESNQRIIKNKLVERRWEIQDTVTNQFLDNDAKLIDRNVIIRLIESEYFGKGKMPTEEKTGILINNKIEYIKTSNNLNVNMLNNFIEMSALKEYVDFIIELKISDYSDVRYPTLRARVMDIKTGSFVGNVTLKDEDLNEVVESYKATNNGYIKTTEEGKNFNSEDKEYVATNDGYKLKTIEKKLDIKKYSELFSEKIMNRFQSFLKREYK